METLEAAQRGLQLDGSIRFFSPPIKIVLFQIHDQKKQYYRAQS